jgi:hypothetical protein
MKTFKVKTIGLVVGFLAVLIAVPAIIRYNRPIEDPLKDENFEKQIRPFIDNYLSDKKFDSLIYYSKSIKEYLNFDIGVYGIETPCIIPIMYGYRQYKNRNNYMGDGLFVTYRDYSNLKMIASEDFDVNACYSNGKGGGIFYIKEKNVTEWFEPYYFDNVDAEDSVYNRCGKMEDGMFYTSMCMKRIARHKTMKVYFITGGILHLVMFFVEEKGKWYFLLRYQPECMDV